MVAFAWVALVMGTPPPPGDLLGWEAFPSDTRQRKSLDNALSLHLVLPQSRTD